MRYFALSLTFLHQTFSIKSVHVQALTKYFFEILIKIRIKMVKKIIYSITESIKQEFTLIIGSFFFFLHLKSKKKVNDEKLNIYEKLPNNSLLLLARWKCIELFHKKITNLMFRVRDILINKIYFSINLDTFKYVCKGRLCLLCELTVLTSFW